MILKCLDRLHGSTGFFADTFSPPAKQKKSETEEEGKGGGTTDCAPLALVSGITELVFGPRAFNQLRGTRGEGGVFLAKGVIDREISDTCREPGMGRDGQGLSTLSVCAFRGNSMQIEAKFLPFGMKGLRIIFCGRA